MPNEKETLPPDPQADAEREERIRERAYQLWEEDGAPDGRAEEYWHRARQLIDDDSKADNRQSSDIAGLTSVSRRRGTTEVTPTPSAIRAHA